MQHWNKKYQTVVRNFDIVLIIFMSENTRGILVSVLVKADKRENSKN